MARSFLPLPAPGAEHPVPPSSRGTFASGDSTLLDKLGTNMAVARARTEGRVPSPASRAYMFYTALFNRALAMEGDPIEADEGSLAGEGREHLRQQARAGFRGLCAVFALREVLGLDIRLERTPLIADADPISRVLVDTLRFAPGRLAFWQPIRYFSVRSSYGGQSEVLAGLSPLTAVFPAAKPPGHALSGAYWYNPPVFRGEHQPHPRQAVWYDPTSNRLAEEDEEFLLNPAGRAAVRSALRAWVKGAMQALERGALALGGIASRDEGLIRQELNAWAGELADAAEAQGVEVVQVPIQAAAGDIVPAFLQLTLRGVAENVLSDLPSHHGRLVVTTSALTDRVCRIWGRRFGHPELLARAESLPAYGENLGDALGIGTHAAPLPFVVVDKLFTPRLTFITSSFQISPEWGTLAVQNGKITEYALLPFEPEILTLLTPQELLDRELVHAELAQDNQHYIVRLRIGGSDIVRLYSISGNEDYLVDDVVPPDALDVRLFPNFDLDSVRQLLPTIPGGKQPDATYYARVRLGPNWAFGVRAFRLDSVNGDRTEPIDIEYLSEPAKRGSNHLAFPEGAFPPGEALFFTLSKRPDGLYFGSRGFCLLRLKPPFAGGTLPATWDIGVDFGTSNTCVAYRVADGEPETLDFPILTTTLFDRPPYGAILDTDEGASGAFDFFYKLQESDRQLNEEAYFPTQILTQQEQLPAQHGVLDLSHGLIHFRNVNLTGVYLLELTQEFGLELVGEGRARTRRFRLEQDIKWTRREWLRTFMSHLRKQVVLTAASRNARIGRVRFSYPRAFSRPEETRFGDEVRKAWGANLLDAERPLLTESEAVRNSFAVAANQRVVFDVGGGTTDIIAFDAQHPVFQTSLKLAARQINDYVAGSPAFREAFGDAVRDVIGNVGTLDLFMGENRSAKEVMNAWVGLLQSLENADEDGKTLSTVTMALQEADGPRGRAVRGFFLSTTMLFGGLAFSAGRLLRAAADGVWERPFNLTGATLSLTGNGSKLYRFLSPDGDDFGPIFEHLFREGLSLQEDDLLNTIFNGIYRLPDGRLAPKVTVALGLLSQSDTDAAPLPVANLLGEMLTDEFHPNSSLTEFYAHIAPDIRRFNSSRNAPPELAAFLDALHRRLPRGMNGRHAVIPGAGIDWHTELKGDMFARAAPGVRDRLHAVITELGQDVEALDDQDSNVPALEPLFIAELAALLDQIRKEHA